MKSMHAFSQRSSLPSSILTGLIGWIGWMFIGPLLFGFSFSALHLFLISIISAFLQVLLLRSLFHLLQMQRHILVGAFWGLATAIGMYYGTQYFFPEMKENHFYWLLIYAYVGAPVGGFLSYFYIDDKKILDAKIADQPANFGRDAHWWEPFAFGVIAYLLAFLPYQNLALAINVAIVGSISGVAAAGASHFSPDRWKQSIPTLLLIILLLGSLQGTLTGFLFRIYEGELLLNHWIQGAIAGVLTYLMTFLRGRQLAKKETEGGF